MKVDRIFAVLAALCMLSPLGVAQATLGPGVVAERSCDAGALGRMVDTVLSPSLSPTVDVCLELRGSCTATTSSSAATVDRTGAAVVFWVSAKVSVAENVESALDCGGTYDVTVVHHGGVGLRYGHSLLAVAPSGSVGGIDVELSSASLAGSYGGCGYVAPVGSCVESHHGSWSYHQVFPGRVTGADTGCAYLEWHNEGIPSFVDASGTMTICSGGLAFASADASALASGGGAYRLP